MNWSRTKDFDEFLGEDASYSVCMSTNGSARLMLFMRGGQIHTKCEDDANMRQQFIIEAANQQYPRDPEPIQYRINDTVGTIPHSYGVWEYHPPLQTATTVMIRFDEHRERTYTFNIGDIVDELCWFAGVDRLTNEVKAILRGETVTVPSLVERHDILVGLEKLDKLQGREFDNSDIDYYDKYIVVNHS